MRPGVPSRPDRRSRSCLGLLVAVMAVCAACGVDPGALDPPGAAGATPSPPAASSTPTVDASSPAMPSPALPSTTARGADEAAAPPPVTATPPAAGGLPSVITTGPANSRKVALTFDADMTPAMLRRLQSGEIASYHNQALIDALQQRRVPATLFLTGLWMQHYPDVTRELAADPLFELGTHTWQHKAFTGNCYGLPSLEPSQMLEEVLRAQRLLDELAGVRATKLFRFPGGCYDTAALRAIASSGVTVVQFDVAGGDGFQPRAAPIVRAVVGHVDNGSIVVLHMNGANTSPRTADAIGTIVDELRAQGYQLSTVSGLFQGSG